MPNRLALRTLALGYLAILLVVPVGFVFYRTFEHGAGAAWHAVTTPAATHAFWLTIELVAIAVPLNTIFGVIMALALVRTRFRGRALAGALVDLPLALSPVVIGLALILVWGAKGWFGRWFVDHGLQIVFSFPGLLLATIFVSLPFVVRETVPVLREIGTEQEEAAETLGAGPLTALLGPSGSGKSTLLRTIAGLEHADRGRVLIDGDDRTHAPARERGVGFVFQHYAAFRHMTVRDNVAFGLTVRKVPKQELRARVAELLELVHLDGFADRLPAQLSGGQRQRMSLARALAVRPSVLLLDEPFGALDATVRKELRAWLRRLHSDMPVTTLFVTHDQEEAMEVAEQIVVMNEGRIEQVGSPRDIYESPASDFVMGFVGPVTHLQDAVVRPHDLEVTVDPIPGSVQAIVERVIHLGFEVRVELTSGDGADLWAQLTRAEAEQLEVVEGQILHVRPVKELARNGEIASAAHP